LNGKLRIYFQRLQRNTSVSSVFGGGGKVCSGGAGNLTSGELVTNGVGAGASSPQSFTGTYSIGADNRGVMTLNFAGSSAKLAFAMTANGQRSVHRVRCLGRGGNDRLGNHGKGRHCRVQHGQNNGLTTHLAPPRFDNVNNRAAIEGRFTPTEQALSPTPLGTSTAMALIMR